MVVRMMNRFMVYRMMHRMMMDRFMMNGVMHRMMVLRHGNPGQCKQSEHNQ
jgi:hypothetical protein